MSTQVQASTAAEKRAADAQNAYAIVQAGAYVPVFLQKLAAAGYPANTEEEASKMLQIASHLRSQYDQHIKSASSKRIDNAYSRVFGAQHQKQAAARQQTQAIDQFAQEMVKDPNMAAALDVLISMES